jgi:hypothetical protein
VRKRNRGRDKKKRTVLHEQLKDLSNEKFRRRTGVKKQTFDKMVEVLTQEDKLKKSKRWQKKQAKYSKSIVINP